MAADEFVSVKSRRKKSNKNNLKGALSQQMIDKSADTEILFTHDDLTSRLDKTRLNIGFPAAIEKTIERVEQWCNNCWKNQNVDLVCYGLGHIYEHAVAREQVICLERLRNLQTTDSKCYCYDPKFRPPEIEYFRSKGIIVIDENEEGKRRIENPTIFYMPHCGKALYNNLLWANWQPEKLKKILIVGNQFSAMEERSDLGSDFGKEYPYIHGIIPYMEEFRVPTDNATLEAFCDTAVISFLSLPHRENDMWKYSKEPEYDVNNVEIITKQS